MPAAGGRHGQRRGSRRESALTCRLLEQFLQAGIEPEAAMKTLNAAMALRGAETGSFTTLISSPADRRRGRRPSSNTARPPAM